MPTCKTAYRLMVADSVAFTRSLRYEIQHGDRNRIPATYSSTAFSVPRHQPPQPALSASMIASIRVSSNALGQSRHQLTALPRSRAS